MPGPSGTGVSFIKAKVAASCVCSSHSPLIIMSVIMPRCIVIVIPCYMHMRAWATQADLPTAGTTITMTTYDITFIMLIIPYPIVLCLILGCLTH